MKGRVLDILLVVTLVLVAFGITYTLLTLNRGQNRPPPDDAPASATGTLPGTAAPPVIGGDGPVVPDGLGGQPPGGSDGLPVIGPDTDDATATDAETDDADEADEADQAPPPPRVLAVGELELNRVGFSHVTGGAGACGVVLEPWEHVAVSRELLADLGCGARVTVTLDEPVDGRTTVTGTIGDTMNPSHEMTVNIYVGEDEPALQYGIMGGSFQAE